MNNRLKTENRSDYCNYSDPLLLPLPVLTAWSSASLLSHRRSHLCRCASQMSSAHARWLRLYSWLSRWVRQITSSPLRLRRAFWSASYLQRMSSYSSSSFGVGVGLNLTSSIHSKKPHQEGWNLAVYVSSSIISELGNEDRKAYGATCVSVRTHPTSLSIRAHL
jgi:hypothetical protein